MNRYQLDGYDLTDLFSDSSPSFSFRDDYKKYVPEYGSIVYTVWNLEKEFVYVGIGGLQDKPLKERNPRSRIREHSSGRRSGDQFCIYVHDFFVLPSIVEKGVYEPSRGYLDKVTKKYIHDNH